MPGHPGAIAVACSAALALELFLDAAAAVVWSAALPDPVQRAREKHSTQPVCSVRAGEAPSRFTNVRGSAC